MQISYVNGKFVNHSDAVVSIDDRGYQFADGVYEVMQIRKGKILDCAEHLVRLKYSLAGLKINFLIDEKELVKIINELLAKNNLQDASCYMQITRGVAVRDHQFPKNAEPVLVMTVSALKTPPKEKYENGVPVISHPDLRWKRRDFKTIQLLPNIMAKQAAIEAGAEESILFEENGVVTEGSATNFFIVKDSILKTHPKNSSILGGITRDGILKVARNSSVRIAEAAFKLDDVYNADEAFISSTTKHILPVSSIDGKKIGDGKPGEITKKLIAAYAKFVEDQIR